MAKKSQTPDAAPAEVEALTFEQAFGELNETVARLEQGNLALEQAMALHARGQLLAKHCADLLERAELRVRQLDPSAPS